jgi:5-hydroxyisourate hydrolase
MSEISPITTYVFDTSTGEAAVGVAVVLKRLGEDSRWHQLSAGDTDINGRLNDLLEPSSLLTGRYRLSFATGEYFQRRAVTALYPQVSIEFQVTDPDEHYHIPLLLAPFSYSTYRESMAEVEPASRG